MRCTAETVKDGILHADQDVRDAAVRYFSNSHSDDPTIMTRVIEAIEKYGFEKAFGAYSFLKDLVQTDDSVHWLIQQLRTLGQRSGKEQVDQVSAYVSALTHADPHVLKRLKDEIMALVAVDFDSRQAIKEKVWFLSRTPEEHWADLEEFWTMAESKEAITDSDFGFACRVIEALARHRDQSADKVLAMLREAGDESGYWRLGFTIRLAGEMRLEAAIPALMAILLKSKVDWIKDECLRAFEVLGTDVVVEQMTAVYQNSDLLLRTAIAYTLEHIHTDRAVEACLALLPGEVDVVPQTILLQSILLNFSTDGIEPARSFILKRPESREALELRDTLLTTCRLMGKTFPEFEDWLDDFTQDTDFRREWLNDDSQSSETIDDMSADAPPPDTVVRREHVGRNDPCPCGSGKKFKKCCYGKTEDAPLVNPLGTPAQSGGLRGNPSQKFPIGTVALYGPNDKVTTKVVAAVIKRAGAEPILQRWVGTNINQSSKVQQQMRDFFSIHGVKSVVQTQGNLGCPHEEGEDFPVGGDCPFCPFWRGKQGSGRRS